MKLENIKDFFSTHIKSFSPYENYSLHKSICDFLVDYYFKHSYEDIPENFISSFENQIIPTEIYDIILESNGFSKDLLLKLNNKDKYILLNSFMDYNKYKGSLKLIEKIAFSFDEKVNIYELFIDNETVILSNTNLIFIHGENYFNVIDKETFDSIKINDIIKSVNLKVVSKSFFNGVYRVFLNDYYNGTSTTTNSIELSRWIFRPYPVYISQGISSIENTVFDYDEILESTKYFFINKYNLEEEKNRNGLILPFKSNLLFLDFNKYQEVNTFYNLIAYTFLQQFKLNKIILYLKDGNYNLSLDKVFMLWYVLLSAYYETPLSSNNVFENFIRFSKVESTFPYNLKDIDNLMVIYNNIKTTRDASLFYNDYIKNIFLDNVEVTNEISNDSVIEYYKSYINQDLMEYIENRIFNNKEEVNIILNEIYNSLITWVLLSNDEYIKKYFQYFANIIPTISYSINESSVYHIIDYTKPYHTEMISQFSNPLKIKDKFNTVINDYEYDFYLESIKVSVMTISDMIRNTINFRYDHDSGFITFALQEVRKISSELLLLQDKLNYYLSTIDMTIVELSHREKFHFLSGYKYYTIFEYYEKLIHTFLFNSNYNEITHEFEFLPENLKILGNFTYFNHNEIFNTDFLNKDILNLIYNNIISHLEFNYYNIDYKNNFFSNLNNILDENLIEIITILTKISYNNLELFENIISASRVDNEIDLKHNKNYLFEMKNIKKQLDIKIKKSFFILYKFIETINIENIINFERGSHLNKTYYNILKDIIMISIFNNNNSINLKKLFKIFKSPEFDILNYIDKNILIEYINDIKNNFNYYYDFNSLIFDDIFLQNLFVTQTYLLTGECYLTNVDDNILASVDGNMLTFDGCETIPQTSTLDVDENGNYIILEN